MKLLVNDYVCGTCLSVQEVFSEYDPRLLRLYCMQCSKDTEHVRVIGGHFNNATSLKEEREKR